MNVVLHFDRNRVKDLEAVFRASDFKFESREHALFLARRPGLTATAYASGKLLLTGAQAEEYANFLAHGTHGLALKRSGEVDAPAPFRPRVGSDESGKGDFFGPLVVAAAAVTDLATEISLRTKGIRDSKAMGDEEAARLARWLEKNVAYRRIVLDPPSYNERHARAGNLNALLDELHSEVISDLLAEAQPEEIVVDQYAARSEVARLIAPLARANRLVLETGAESKYVAVAAASVLARAEFISQLARLSADWGVALHKGAGAPTMASARAFVARHGREALREVAKMHFANTSQL